MGLTVIGSVAIDSIETGKENRKDVLGGSATYASIGAAFFTSVNLLSVVGEDFPGKYLKMFKMKGVNVEGLEIKKGKTFVALPLAVVYM